MANLEDKSYLEPTSYQEVEFFKAEIKKHLQSLSFDIRYQKDLNVEPVKDRMFRDISSLFILFRHLERLV